MVSVTRAGAPLSPPSTKWIQMVFVLLRFSDETGKRCFSNWKMQDCLVAAGRRDPGTRKQVAKLTSKLMLLAEKARHSIGYLSHTELLCTGVGPDHFEIF